VPPGTLLALAVEGGGPRRAAPAGGL